MAQLMRLGYDETVSTNDGKLFVVEFRRSKADGLTFDIVLNNTGEMFMQSVFSYDALYRARKDARTTLHQIGEYFDGN